MFKYKYYWIIYIFKNKEKKKWVNTPKKFFFEYILFLWVYTFFYRDYKQDDSCHDICY